ncbi:MAG: apolipoprotein N-acyltransferase [Gammaproteobacteria bacterium]|nr:apolipoprotein N-acyltransferase [Gammaproteobacteria bacterium]
MRFIFNIIYFLGAFLAGAILPLAFAPKGIYILAVLSPLLLFYVLENTSPKTAFWRGLIYGLGFFGFGAYWIFISINTYGSTNLFISSFITFGFICILSLFPGFMGYVYRKFNAGTPQASLFQFIFLWVIFEWIRSWFLTGFPWLLLGQSQTNSPLHGYAPIIGLYGISFLTVFSASLIYTILKNYRKLFAVTLNGFLLLVIWLGGYGLTFIQWTHPISKPFSITLIQGNIPEMMKWDPQQAYKSLKTYETLTKPFLGKSTLIVWPETAVTFLLPDAIPHLELLDKVAEKTKSAILTGIPIPNNNQYYNGAIMLGDGEGHYYKRHLVPFGEYIPLESLLRGLIGFFNLPMSDFSEGPQAQNLMSTDGMYIGPFICYEIAYTHLLRTDLPLANVLVTMSNDSWFDQSEALAQHLQITQLAAEMSQRYMLVATNSGKTAVIDPNGNILVTAPENQVAYITATIQAMGGTTPWITYGNWPILILMGLGLACCWKRR